jgi:hypothetical protein
MTAGIVGAAITALLVAAWLGIRVRRHEHRRGGTATAPDPAAERRREEIADVRREFILLDEQLARLADKYGEPDHAIAARQVSTR